MDLTVFQRNLKQLLEARNLTGQSFADEIGIPSATVYRYLNGDRTPDLAYLVKICSFFSVSLDWILGLSGDIYDVMPKELQEIANRYSLASPDDRRVIQAVLRKYNQATEDNT